MHTWAAKVDRATVDYDRLNGEAEDGLTCTAGSHVDKFVASLALNADMDVVVTRKPAPREVAPDNAQAKLRHAE
jgi:hypothetical protein